MGYIAACTLWSKNGGPMALWHWFLKGSDWTPFQNQCYSAVGPPFFDHSVPMPKGGSPGREQWNISPRVTLKRARPRRVRRTLHNYTGRELPFRATPDTPPLAAAMLPHDPSSSVGLVC